MNQVVRCADKGLREVQLDQTTNKLRDAVFYNQFHKGTLSIQYIVQTKFNQKAQTI